MDSVDSVVSLVSVTRDDTMVNVLDTGVIFGTFTFFFFLNNISINLERPLASLEEVELLEWVESLEWMESLEGRGADDNLG